MDTWAGADPDQIDRLAKAYAASCAICQKAAQEQHPHDERARQAKLDEMQNKVKQGVISGLIALGCPPEEVDRYCQVIVAEAERPRGTHHTQ
jgi:hypothetical protein